MRQAIRIPRKRMRILKYTVPELKKAGAKIIIAGDAVDVDAPSESFISIMNVVKAIGRGFSAKKSLLLLEEDQYLIIITLDGETEKTTKRLMSRVIGKEGRAKKNIQRMTGCSICISGKTIAIIGTAGGVDAASSAVEDLLKGKKHATMYINLEKRNRMRGKAVE